ncbi:MAG TPA: hypothetical protein VMH81_08895 [Bryobacteraceae bacterium]|nr:hypothetical protein [Bryobacteraceae bacterium]
MRRVEAILATAIALGSSGCVLKRKPQTVAAAPAPPKPVSLPTPEPPRTDLSVPQTNVELPPPQPVNPDAIASAEPSEKTNTISAPRTDKPSRTRATQASNAAAQHTEPVGPVVPPAPPTESVERPPIQEILPPAELHRLQMEAVKNRQEIQKKLQQLGRRPLSPEQIDMRDKARSFVTQSDEAQKAGDMRKAAEFAAKGLVLARALVEGR